MKQYRARFEQMIRELKARPELDVRIADIGAPTSPQSIADAQRTAGPAWPPGMTELYSELSYLDLEYTARAGELHGAIHIPPVGQVWDYVSLEDELWFDFLPANDPFHRIRPIDRFVPEAYAVLFPVPANQPASVHYHYCGEDLVPTGLSYEAWLEMLFKTRGVAYWLKIPTRPAPSTSQRTWVDEGYDALAKLFPDFDPRAGTPSRARGEIPRP